MKMKINIEVEVENLSHGATTEMNTRVAERYLNSVLGNNRCGSWFGSKINLINWDYCKEVNDDA